MAQKLRAVTINLKHGAPVNGNFIQADTDTIQVDVAGNRLHIKVDDVTSISFATDANARASQVPTRTTENIDQALRALRKLTREQRRSESTMSSIARSLLRQKPL
jgi:hypothetical protein